MNVTQRTAWCVVCDDVRQEVGSKYSMMGVYHGVILLPSFPATLPKLCFVISARTDTTNPFKELSFRVSKNDEEILAEATIDVTTISSAPSLEPTQERDGFLIGLVVCAFTPIVFTEPCKLSARAYTEAGELKAGTILIRQSDAALSDSNIPNS